MSPNGGFSCVSSGIITITADMWGSNPTDKKTNKRTPIRKIQKGGYYFSEHQKCALRCSWTFSTPAVPRFFYFNPLKPELNSICYLLALLAHHFLHVSRIRVKSLTHRLLMSYIYIYIYMQRLFLMFLHHTQRRSTVGRTPLDE